MTVSLRRRIDRIGASLLACGGFACAAEGIEQSVPVATNLAPEAEAATSVEDFAAAQPQGNLLPRNRIYLRNNSTSNLTFYLFNVEGANAWQRVRMRPSSDVEIPARTLWIAVGTGDPSVPIATLNPLLSRSEAFSWESYQVRLLRQRTRSEICFSSALNRWVIVSLEARAC